MVIDGRTAYTGGSLNMVDPRFFKQGAGVGEWVDAMVGPKALAEGLATTFLEDWEMETGEAVELLSAKSPLARLRRGAGGEGRLETNLPSPACGRRPHTRCPGGEGVVRNRMAPRPSAGRRCKSSLRPPGEDRSHSADSAHGHLCGPGGSWC